MQDYSAGQWALRRLKYVISEHITDGPHTTPEFVDEGVPFLSVDSIQDGELVFDKCRFISYSDHAIFSKKAKPCVDDVLLAKAASVGKIARVKVEFEFNIWSPLAIIRPDLEKIFPAFLEYGLKSANAQFQIAILSTSNTQKNISMDDIPKLLLPLPPLPEQQAIAIFLDRETARIDALVARKERLLELLEEKRKAIISQAVTRGLDASVPMKDSGVEWLGQVPEGWAVQRLKNLSRFVTSGSRGWAEFYADSGSTFIRIGNLQRRSIDPDLSDIQYVNVPAGSEGERTRIQDGDVLISITADLGSVATAGVNLQGAYVSQHVALVRLQSGINPRWLAYAVMGDTAKSHFKMASYGGTKIQLSLEDVRETPVFVPPPAEQQAIALYLDTQAAKLDALRQKMKQSVEKLSEYRTSLISAAVTGKIDVRGEVPDQKDVSA